MTTGAVVSPTPTDSCSRYAEATCGRVAACSPFFLRVGYGDIAACVARTASACKGVLGLDGTRVTADGLTACASAYAGLSCDAIYDAALPAACDGLAGSRAVGQPCATALQCASGACSDSSDEPCGVCLEVVGSGAACDDARRCGPGLYCSAGACADLVGRGGACGPGARCNPALACIGGVCASPLGESDACDPDEVGCDLNQGLFCSSADRRCVRATIAGPSEACGDLPGSASFVYCAVGTYCHVTQGARGTCEPRVPDGAACATGPSAAECALPARCVDGVCTASPASCP